jgi:hypothetical protein
MMTMIWIGKTTASGMARFADAGDVAGGRRLRRRGREGAFG